MPTDNKTTRTEPQHKDGSIVTVKKKNSHGFKVGEKIKIINADPLSQITGVPETVPVYRAHSVDDITNQWWIAETEIKESKPPTANPSPSAITVGEIDGKHWKTNKDVDYGRALKDLFQGLKMAEEKANSNDVDKYPNAYGRATMAIKMCLVTCTDLTFDEIYKQTHPDNDDLKDVLPVMKETKD